MVVDVNSNSRYGMFHLTLERAQQINEQLSAISAEAIVNEQEYTIDIGEGRDQVTQFKFGKLLNEFVAVGNNDQERLFIIHSSGGAFDYILHEIGLI